MPDKGFGYERVSGFIGSFRATDLAKKSPRARGSRFVAAACSQRLRNPLIKEYPTLSYNGNPNKI